MVEGQNCCRGTTCKRFAVNPDLSVRPSLGRASFKGEPTDVSSANHADILDCLVSPQVRLPQATLWQLRKLQIINIRRPKQRTGARGGRRRRAGQAAIRRRGEHVHSDIVTHDEVVDVTRLNTKKRELNQELKQALNEKKEKETTELPALLRTS